MLAATRDAVLVNSFSKYFSMTGWRLGWMVVPQHLRDAVERLQQNVYICAPHVSQVAGLAAFDATDELDGHVRRYAENRTPAHRRPRRGRHHRGRRSRRSVLRLRATSPTSRPTPATRWRCAVVGSTSWASPPRPGSTSTSLAATEFVRFSYAGNAADIAEACDRLQQWSPCERAPTARSPTCG